MRGDVVGVGHVASMPDGAWLERQQGCRGHSTPATWQRERKPVSGCGNSELGSAGELGQLWVSEHLASRRDPGTAGPELAYAGGLDSYAAEHLGVGDSSDLPGSGAWARQPKAGCIDG